MRSRYTIHWLLLLFPSLLAIEACHQAGTGTEKNTAQISTASRFPVPDTTQLGTDEFSKAVRYGRELMLHTAQYIGPDGSVGHYLGNRMNCSNCHQEAGAKAFSVNLMRSHINYPQYRSRENRVLTLAERVNNCIERPHNGRPLPLDSKEMIAFLSYLKWINGFIKPGQDTLPGFHNKKILFPERAASPANGQALYAIHCQRCHGESGNGMMATSGKTYLYPPLWGSQAYQRGSSMHRNIKLAEWLTMNMPFDKVMPGKPFLTDEQALDLAAFVNDDARHGRPQPGNSDYPNAVTKPIDYDKAPFADKFSETEHKFGPYKPIIAEAENAGRKVIY